MNKSRFSLLAGVLIGPILLIMVWVMVVPTPVTAATPGLPFTEDFSDTALQDPLLTNANWSTAEQALILSWRQKQFGAFGAGLTGSDTTADVHDTHAVALGDVDGDGDLDPVAGNFTQLPPNAGLAAK